MYNNTLSDIKTLTDISYIENDNDNTVQKKNIINLAIFDIIAFVTSIVIFTAIKQELLFKPLNTYYIFFTIYFLLFESTSLIFYKKLLKENKHYYKNVNRLIILCFISAFILFASVFLFGFTAYKIKYFLFFILLFFSLDFILYSLVFAFRYAQMVHEKHEKEHILYMMDVINREKNDSSIFPSDNDGQFQYTEQKCTPSLNLDIIYDPDVKNFIEKHINYSIDNNSILLSTNRRFNLLGYPDFSFDQITNIQKINHIKHINKFFEVVYSKLKKGGIFILCAETIALRKHRIARNYFFPLPFLVRFFDYIIHRLWPKLPYVRSVYFAVWGHRNKRISYAEVLGRLYSCGFVYVSEMESQNKLYLAVKKQYQPVLDYNATYSPIIKLKRVGKNQKLFYLYKIRTMHPFSEFLQDFIYERNHLDKTGKFKNDFRVTTLGKIMRKLWIDEIPSFINLLKNEVKLVGVRPISIHFFNLYPDELKELRTKYKPGLVPPYYADLPETFEEILESEKKYLLSYEKNKIITDIKYLFKAFWNIFFKGARSK